MNTRDVKFRAWNGKEIVSREKLVFWNGNCYLNPTGTLNDPEQPHKPAKLDRLRGYSILEVMQYTGLHDKNGAEIYEGDIVRFKWNPIFNDPSELFEWELPVEYDAVWGCFVMRIRSKTDDEVKVAVGSPVEAGQNIEVIGNLYEPRS